MARSTLGPSHPSRGGAVVAAVILLSFVPGCADSPTGPSGPTLAGTWRTAVLQLQVGATPVEFIVEFTVDAAGSQVSDVALVTAKGALALGGGAAISASSFTYAVNVPRSGCNGEDGRFELTGSFTSSARAQGTWRDSNVGVPLGCFSGTADGSWTATKSSP